MERVTPVNPLSQVGRHGSQRGSHVRLHDESHGGGHSRVQHPPRSTVCVWSSSFDCRFDCVASLSFDASTVLPLFWFVSPWFQTALLSPLTTTGADVPVWSALFEAEFDWVADCDTSPDLPQQPEPSPVTVCVWSSSFDCRFDCVASLSFDASTVLPLFWFVSPPADSHELHPS